MERTMFSRKVFLNAMLWMLPIPVGLLIAGDPAWKDKPIPGWTTEDARQILAARC
jgi:hypothetical protein